MLRSLNSGVSGLQQFQNRLDIIGNNIANVSTTGYKAARAEFADTLSQTIGGGAGGNMQIGTGVTTTAITSIFNQGGVTRTSSPTDLAITGEGFFLVKDIASSAVYATRAGEFHVDNSGYLVNNRGMRAQGYSDSALSTYGDIQIDPTGSTPIDPNASVASFYIDQTGQINVRLSDGTEFVRGEILLQSFKNPQALTKEGSNLYANLTDAGPIFDNAASFGKPGTQGLGRIESGALELSNVDIASEFASLITTQRAFQASARIITTSDEVLQEVVSLKR